MSRYLYTCARAQKSLVGVVRILKDVDILQAVPDDELLEQCVKRCDPCRKRGKAKHCRGWRTVVERGSLSFGPLTHKGGRQIRIEISANCDYRRPAPGRQDAWDRLPLASSVVTLEIFEVETEELLERHHLDLANAGSPGQPGPVWHLQMGGNPADSVDPTETGWLDLPRWPTPPMDLTLAIEFLTYSFFPEKWEKLNERSEWFQLVVGAEQLVVSHFAEHMTNHFRRKARDRDCTWLTAQDNRSGAFDPRPHST